MPTPHADRRTSGRRAALLAVTLVALWLHALPASAQDTSATKPEAPLQENPLSRAHDALQRAEFEQLRPLLSSFIDTEAFHALSPEDRAQARSLLALGLYFEGQSLADAMRASELLAHARAQLQVAILDDPEHTLDPLVFPADLIALQRTLRTPLPLPGSRAAAPDDASLIYVERRITRRSPWVTLLPMGAGQFQNGHPLRGALVAATQVLGLAANLVGFWQVESLRDPQGRIATADSEQARRWQTLQWTGLAVAGLSWGLGAGESFYHFEAEDVALRTLDAPPAELRDLSN